jgi:hypothetical protein
MYPNDAQSTVRMPMAVLCYLGGAMAADFQGIGGKTGTALSAKRHQSHSGFTDPKVD